MVSSSLQRKRVSVVSLSERMKVSPNKPKALFGCRHKQVLLMCMGFFCCYAIRVTTSVTLEAMTNAANANSNFEEFDWDLSVRQLILSSFFWGYTCTQIPASLLIQRWSAHKLFSATMILCGLLTLSTPIGAHYGGWETMIAIRVMCGLIQGSVLPCLHTLLSRWSPPDERGRFASFVYSGGWIGNVVCLLTSGFFAASPTGWPGVFYVWGSINSLCGIAFYFFGKDSPSEHSGMPLDEKEYIEISLGITEVTETLTTPWMSILKSVPVWALLIVQSVQAWGFWMLLTEIPIYMTSIMRFDIKQNGLMTSLPYLTAWIVSFPVSYVSDLCIRRNIVKTEMCRKICNTLGHWIPAVALIGVGYAEHDQPELAVGLLILAVSSNVAIFCGHNVNHMELSPNFAGILMGFTNTLASCCTIFAPLIASLIVKDPTDILQWQIMFYLSAGIYTAGNLIFVIFGTSKVQKWNDPVAREDSVAQKEKPITSIAMVEEEKNIEKVP